MDLISPITKNSDDYDGKCLKIKFASKDSLNKTIEVHNAQLVVRADFHEKKQIFSVSFLRLMPIWIINNIKLLYYDIIDVSEGTDVNKTNESKVCDICHYWYFLNKGFKFQSNFCNTCNDLFIMSVNIAKLFF